MKRLMSLDISSTTIGLAIIDYDDNEAQLFHKEYYKPTKKGNLFERLSSVQQYIKDKIKEFNPDCFSMEDIVLFMGNKSTAQTITTLAVLNRIIGLTIYNNTNKIPYLYNAMRIRHAIKIGKILPPKEDIPELVSKILKFKFDFKMRKSKGKMIPAEENYDVADAIACGICHVYMDRSDKADALQVKKKKKRKKKVSK
jgi:Holliday junction resolvasome RuvABC endonuclease subunit